MAGKSGPTGGQQNTEHKKAASKRKSGSGSGEVGGDPADRCDIRVDVDLEGIRLPILNGVRIGDVFTVGLEFRDQRPIAVALREDRMIVGALAAFQGYSQFLQCLQDGVTYQIKVTEINAGHCHVVGGRTA
jgi:hypothetical protein